VLHPIGHPLQHQVTDQIEFGILGVVILAAGDPRQHAVDPHIELHSVVRPGEDPNRVDCAVTVFAILGLQEFREFFADLIDELLCCVCRHLKHQMFW